MSTDPLTVEVVTVADLCVGDLWRKGYGDTAFREILAVRREHRHGITYAVIEYSTATGRGEGRFKLDLPAERRYVPPKPEVIPADVLALVAATFSRDADTVEAVDATWAKLREIFPASLAPEPDEDGFTRIEEAV